MPADPLAQARAALAHDYKSGWWGTDERCAGCGAFRSQAGKGECPARLRAEVDRLAADLARVTREREEAAARFDGCAKELSETGKAYREISIEKATQTRAFLDALREAREEERAKAIEEAAAVCARVMSTYQPEPSNGGFVGASPLAIAEMQIRALAEKDTSK